MIFGDFNINNSGKINHELLNFDPLNNFDKLKLRDIKFGNLHCGILFNHLLHSKLEENISINIEKNIIVIKYGHIYNRLTIIKDKCYNAEINEPELIQKLFIKSGPEFINQLNGDFILIIYEADINTLYIFRDHIGIYPLAYTHNAESFYFSADILQLCRAFHDNEIINPEYLISEFRFADLNQTPNPKVAKLPPGHYLKYSNGKILIIKYWEPEKIKLNFGLSKEQVINDLRSLVEDAVNIRSDKSFKTSAHLSGGLDSSVVAALVRKELSDQDAFYGYSWSPENFAPEEVEYDERNLVIKTCALHNIIPVFINLNADDYLKLSINYIRNLGAFAEEKILEHAKCHNINLIFSGWGGDEFVSKGERGINTDLIVNFDWTLFFKRNTLRQPKEFLKTLLYDILFPAINMVNFGHKKAHKRFTRYLKVPFNKNHYPSVKKFLFYRSRRQLHLGFLYHYHISNRTETSYIQGFIHGVEYCYPLLDKRIVEYMLSVPSKFLVEGKYSRMVLREISKGLVPEEVTWIRKGIDPVYHANNVKNCLEAAMIFTNKIDEYKLNPDLHFINFDLLIKDLQKFKEKNNYSDEFIDNIIIINNLNEFTKHYHNKDFYLY